MAETAAAPPVSLEWAEEFAEKWLAAWNSHQPERLLELMTEDIVYDDSAWAETMRGHGDVRRFLEYTWRAFPDMTFEPVGGALIGADGPRAAFWWRGRATNTGPIDPPGLPLPASASSSRAPTSTSTATARWRGCGSCSTWPI